MDYPPIKVGSLYSFGPNAALCFLSPPVSPLPRNYVSHACKAVIEIYDSGQLSLALRYGSAVFDGAPSTPSVVKILAPNTMFLLVDEGEKVGEIYYLKIVVDNVVLYAPIDVWLNVIPFTDKT